VIVPGCGSVLSSLSSPVLDEGRTRSIGDCTWLWSVLSSLGSPVVDEESTRSVGDCTWLWSVFLHYVVR